LKIPRFGPVSRAAGGILDAEVDHVLSSMPRRVQQ
jgi:hypothetical protein